MLHVEAGTRSRRRWISCLWMALVRASLCSTRETPPVSIPPRKHAVDSLNVSANITAAGKAINDPVSESDAQAARVASEKSRTVPAAPNTTVSARQVEKSQSSFGAFNKLLHGFTASKTPKGTVKKGSNLTDAQIAKIRYKSKDNFAGSALHILHRGINYIVYIATAKETGLKLLLKVYDLNKMSQKDVSAAKQEIDMLTRLQHEGIARCRGTWQDEKHLYSVQEYGIRGDLFIEMFSERQRLTERFIACKVLKPLLQALQYIHSHNIIHRSILPENLHFDKDLNINLTHFSSAWDLASGPVLHGPDSLSVVDYLAPEVLQHSNGSNRPGTPSPVKSGAGIQLFPFGDEYQTSIAAGSKVPPFRKAGSSKQPAYDQKVDIWAVGCLLFELLAGKGPFEVASKHLTCALILWGEIQHFPDKLSQPCISFIQACLTKDPTARPSADALLQHTWLIRQLEAKAAGIPEGLEFKPSEQQAPASSSMWVTRQLSRLRGNHSNASTPSSTSRFHLPSFWRSEAADIEMGQLTDSLHADIKRKFGAVSSMRS